MDTSGHFSDRVLTRLEQAEARELNPHLCTDIRIAWITVLRAAAGSPIPHIEAWYRVLGLHPDRVWPAIVARRQAQLGREYSLWYDAAGNLKSVSGSQVDQGPAHTESPLESPDIGDGVSLPEFTRKEPVRSERRVTHVTRTERAA